MSNPSVPSRPAYPPASEDAPRIKPLVSDALLWASVYAMAAALALKLLAYGLDYEAALLGAGGAVGYLIGAHRDMAERDRLHALNSRLRDTCWALERERDEAAEYGHRLLEDRAFYAEQSQIALEVADLPLRGYFGLIPAEMKGEVIL